MLALLRGQGLSLGFLAWPPQPGRTQHINTCRAPAGSQVNQGLLSRKEEGNEMGPDSNPPTLGLPSHPAKEGSSTHSTDEVREAQRGVVSAARELGCTLQAGSFQNSRLDAQQVSGSH